MEFKLFGERVFPIYSIVAKWVEDILEGKTYPESWTEGLPEGRFRNQTSASFMLKDSLSHEDKEKTLNEWWAQYSASEKFDNISDVELKLTFVRFDSWNCVWFSHETFDYGQTDDEAIKSFQNYIYRVQDLNEKYKWETGSEYDKICLMGAEDRWRWFSFNEDESHNFDNPVCRCEGCKKSGKLRISH